MSKVDTLFIAIDPAIRESGTGVCFLHNDNLVMETVNLSSLLIYLIDTIVTETIDIKVIIEDSSLDDFSYAYARTKGEKVSMSIALDAGKNQGACRLFADTLDIILEKAKQSKVFRVSPKQKGPKKTQAQAAKLHSRYFDTPFPTRTSQDVRDAHTLLCILLNRLNYMPRNVKKI